MMDEIPYKYKYIVNKIMKCIIKYISKNLTQNLLIESKLILINNYIIDIFNNSEPSSYTNINLTINKKHNQRILLDKGVSSDLITSKYDNKFSFNKIRNIIFNSGIHVKKDNSSKDDNDEKNKNKDKFKIIKLDKLLKNDNEKTKIKELPQLKRLSVMKDKLNFNESNKEKKNRAKNSFDLECKSNSCIFDEEKLKSKINNNSISLRHNFDSINLIDSPQINKVNIFRPNINRKEKYSSLSQMNIFKKDISCRIQESNK